MLFFVGLAALVATLLGGLFALQFKDKLHLVLGFSAGAVLGVAIFDLIPEAFELSAKFHDAGTVALVIGIGFAVYLTLDRLVLLHSHDDDACHEHVKKGFLGAGSLSLHSFFDGFMVGASFLVSPVVGMVVTAAVLAHDFSDGMNTVNFILRGKGSKSDAIKWLFVDAIAPVVGIMVALVVNIPESFLGLVLAIFAGSFLYIGASDLLPESHHAHPYRWTTVATLLGMATLYFIIKLAGV